MFNQRKIKNNSNSVGGKGVLFFIVYILIVREKPRVQSLRARVAKSVGNVWSVGLPVSANASKL